MENRRGRSSGSVPAPQRDGDARKHRRRAGRRRAAAVFALALAAVLPVVPAGAAVEPGTPLAVSPGVPAHGRAWELITPEDPVPAAVLWFYELTGDRAAYATIGPLPDAPSGEPLPAPALASRSSTGWSSHSLSTPVPGLPTIMEPGPVAFGPNLESSIWGSQLLSGEPGLFRRAPDGTFTLLAAGATFLGASADLSHVVFESAEHLLPTDAGRTEGKSIYELSGSTLRQVDVDDNGTLLSPCGASGRRSGSVSKDGRRIFFTARPDCAGPRRVFLRSDGATTTEISASQCDLPDCGPAGDVSFVGASPSGAVAFLATEERLTNDDTDLSADLYRYQVSDGSLSLVTGGPAEVIPSANDAVRVSVDGSRAYFIATDLGRPGGQAAHLYLADERGAHEVPGADMSSSRFHQVTPDGRYVAYVTQLQAKAADTDEGIDLYRYDAETDNLALVSAGEGGRGNSGDAAVVESWFGTETVYRFMSDDGNRVFFWTLEQLLPEDRNQLNDVYEWAGGDLGLISSGAGPPSSGPGSLAAGSKFTNLTGDGTTAVIETGDTLLPRDRDGSDADYYAARIGGGHPEPLPPGRCDGSCASARGLELERPRPATARERGGRITLAKIGPEARRRAVASGWLTLLVEVPRRGRLSGEARARIGGTLRTVAAASIRVREPGPARLRMRLSKAARRALGQGRDLRVRLRLRLAGFASSRRVAFELKGRR